LYENVYERDGRDFWDCPSCGHYINLQRYGFYCSNCGSDSEIEEPRKEYNKYLRYVFDSRYGSPTKNQPVIKKEEENITVSGENNIEMLDLMHKILDHQNSLLMKYKKIKSICTSFKSYFESQNARSWYHRRKKSKEKPPPVKVKQKKKAMEEKNPIAPHSYQMDT